MIVHVTYYRRLQKHYSSKKKIKNKKDHISIDNVDVRFLSITGQKLEEE